MNKGNDDAWRFTGFYEELITHLRHESWSLLHDLNNSMSLPWPCFGDFIELVGHSKKLGGANKNQNQTQLFRNIMMVVVSYILGLLGGNSPGRRTLLMDTQFGND